MEQTNLYGTYDKGTNSFVNYFNAPSDIAAERYVKGNLKAMDMDKKLPDQDTIDCLSLYKITEVSPSELATIVTTSPLATFTDLLGKVQN